MHTPVPSTAPAELRLGRHHFAYLRAVAEGIGVPEAAKRYLAIEHGNAAAAAHRAVVERVRLLARRRGDSRWRLIGLALPDKSDAPTDPGTPLPPIDEWAEAQGLTEWSQDDLHALYAERFGATLDDSTHRRQARHRARNARLRAHRLALLDELEASAAQQAAPTDRIDGWLPAPLAQQLQACGLLLLADLRALITQGGRWWRGLPGTGPIKARRLSELLDMLLGASHPAPAPVSWARLGLGGTVATAQRLSGAHGANRAPLRAGGTAAANDREAIAAWITNRAGSAYTARQYAREAERFLLFCIVERGKALSDAGVDDCTAYREFLADVPAGWISRRHVARMQPGWAPFKGPLSIASQSLSLTIVNALFAWLVQAHYLAANPWTLVSRRLGDDPSQPAEWAGAGLDGSRAFTPSAWKALFHYLDRMPATPAHERLRWMCTFVEATGVRAAELLHARRGDFSQRSAGWVLQVFGKGQRLRTVAVPSAAMRATERYFAARDLDFASAAPEVPLIAALDHPGTPPSYRALYETFTRFVRRALKHSDLPLEERLRAQRASTHWLRHTHATRAAERNVPPDVLQKNLGQSDPRTTARYYAAQIERQQREMERAFGAEG